MKKNVGFLILMIGTCAASVSASEWALVYPANSQLESNKLVVGAVTPAGVAISASSALSLGASCYLALLGEGLRVGTLGRLDGELNIAVFKIGEAVADPTLNVANQKNLISYENFLGRGSESGQTSLAEGMSADGLLKSTEPFVIKINGQLSGGEPIVLDKKKENGEVLFEIVNLSTGPLWKLSMTVESTPSLSFWKKGRQKDLNDVPRPKFQYDYQALFVPWKKNDVIKIPVELYFIKSESYVWTFKFEGKGTEFVKKVPLRFISK